MMPSILLSGYIFPIGNMPDVIQYATMLNPLRWYLYVLRSIVQKGAGLQVLMPALLAQTALAVGFIAIAAARFKKTSG
jgi:ABC-2 type transport system permease protein